jgi:dihydrofolate synthase/folylpolyglutamate synthase
VTRSLAAWLELQQRVHLRSIDLGLDRIRPVAARLGLWPAPFPSILVGGTNGKGSTVAHLAAFARAAGLSIGVFTSPHLVRYNERVRLADADHDRLATDAELIAAFERIEAARGATTLTFFEYNTLAAFELFTRARVDLGIVEVGLGGRLDSTNILDADVAVLCSVGLDHCEWLGDTVEAIGAEKAGIFRAGRPVVLGSADMPRSVATAIDALGADPRWPQRDFRVERSSQDMHWSFHGRRWHFERLPSSALAGPIQYTNAATALAAFEAFTERRMSGLRFDAAMAQRGLETVALPGRLQIVAGAPEWILDVAHNPAAAAVLAAALRARPCAGRTLAVCGMLADKDAVGVAAALAPLVDEWLLAGIHEPRGLDAATLAQRLPADCAVVAQAVDVAAACAAARARAQATDRIIVFGSFHTVGPALEWLGLY